MMRARQTILPLAAALVFAGGAAAQTPPISAGTLAQPGEQQTPLVSQALTNDPVRLQAVLSTFADNVVGLLRDQIGPDVDMTLSYKMLSFYHIQVDLAQVLLRFSTDPELRRFATRDIENAAARISVLRNWQVSRQILQQQITGSHTLGTTGGPIIPESGAAGPAGAGTRLPTDAGSRLPTDAGSRLPTDLIQK